MRALACRRLDGLGIVLDEGRNEHGESTVSTAASPVAILVVATDEELAIARHTAELVAARSDSV